MPALVSPDPVQLQDGDDVEAGCSSRTTASARRPHRRTHIPASVAERWGSRAGGWARGANGIRGAGSALATQSRRSSRWERVGAGSDAPTHRGAPVIHTAAPRGSSQSLGHPHFGSPVSSPRLPAHCGAPVTCTGAPPWHLCSPQPHSRPWCWLCSSHTPGTPQHSPLVSPTWPTAPQPPAQRGHRDGMAALAPNVTESMRGGDTG